MAKPKQRKQSAAKQTSTVLFQAGAENVVLNAENVRPVYANWAQVAASNNEFKLVFAEVIENTPQKSVTREWARVYITPLIAKALLHVLAGGIEKYEKDYGLIHLPALPTVKRPPS